MVGQIPQPEPIAAVGVGAVVLSAVYWIFGFLRMGTAGLTAQAAGARNSAEVAAMLTRSLMIGLAGGVVLIVLQSLIFWGAFQLSPASAEVEGLARQYMQIRIWSAPAAIAVFGINGWLIAQERTRAILTLQLWMNGLNVSFDLLFVLGLGWGVGGVATATFIAEWGGLAMGLSAAIGEEITFAGGEVEQMNFPDYPALRMPDMPQVSVRILENQERLNGVGEVAVPPAAPALANALFDLTGERVRSLPLNKRFTFWA